MGPHEQWSIHHICVRKPYITYPHVKSYKRGSAMRYHSHKSSQVLYFWSFIFLFFFINYISASRPTSTYQYVKLYKSGRVGCDQSNVISILLWERRRYRLIIYTHFVIYIIALYVIANQLLHTSTWSDNIIYVLLNVDHYYLIY